MTKILVVLVLGMLTLNALACGGGKDEEEKKKFQTIETILT